jgi:hypothetical protein
LLNQQFGKDLKNKLNLIVVLVKLLFCCNNLTNPIMKTLKSIMLGIALMAIVGAVEGKNVKGTRFTKTHAIDVFVNAMTQGRLSDLNNVVDQNAEFSLLRDKTIINFSRKEMLDFLKTTKNIEQACTTSTSIIANDANVEIVKVNMKFNGFVRSNYVTIANTGSGWKITNVYSVFV